MAWRPAMRQRVVSCSKKGGSRGASHPERTAKGFKAVRQTNALGGHDVPTAEPAKEGTAAQPTNLEDVQVLLVADEAEARDLLTLDDREYLVDVAVACISIWPELELGSGRHLVSEGKLLS